MTDQVAEPVDDAAPGSVYQRWRDRRRRRVSKWDRPPPPHDWRFFVGGAGKILIAVGLLMFGFVGYQLWGTGIETARAQNKLQDQFAELIADSPPATTAPATTAAPAASPPDVPTTSAPPDTSAAPTTVTSTSPATTVPVAETIPAIEPGQPLARLEMPRIGKQGDDALYVVPGVEVDDLKKGPGHYPDTPLPGQLGNAAIAGHRTTFGEPFRHIDELVPGDELIVTMFTGARFVFAVTGTEIVGPEDYYVVTTRDPTVAMLTLTSCDPVYSARNRIAVHAELVPELSSPVTPATFYDLDSPGPDDDAGQDETTDETTEVGTTEVGTTDETTEETTGETTEVETSDTATGPDDTGTSTDDPVVDDTEAEPAPVDTSSTQPPIDSTVPAGGEVQDAFGTGWFHDREAWPQIALWGTALILIAIGMRMISRRVRHDSIGIAAGIVPFVVCLYFFYQNVNRLLPPGF